MEEIMDIAVTALHPIQMQQSQQQLIEWCHEKIKATLVEAQEMQEAYEKAKKNKWKTDVLHRHAGLARKRHEYFIKIHAALMEGYYIVPNFPIQTFVIKTRLKAPRYQNKGGSWYINSEKAEELPLGIGEYQNPSIPIVEHHDVVDGKTHTHATSGNYFYDVEFPINMAKPMIMDAAAKAMREKIFDQMGVLPDFQKKKDPLIIGQILGHNKIVSFMVAWHLNTNVL
jgi:hypothetical protein